jgi:hypothetical protein
MPDDRAAWPNRPLWHCATAAAPLLAAGIDVRRRESQLSLTTVEEIDSNGAIQYISYKKYYKIAGV